MRLLLALAAGRLLLAASASGIGPAIAADGSAEDASLPTSFPWHRPPPVAQTPDTNPPGRDECRRLSAEARARRLDDQERDRLSLCLATHRDGPGPALDEPGTAPPGREGQG